MTSSISSCYFLNLISMEGLNPQECIVYTAVAEAGSDGILNTRLRTVTQTMGLSTQDCLAALRTLIENGRLAITRTATGECVIGLRRANVSSNFNVVLSTVRSAGNTGIDANTIAAKTKIAKSEVVKALQQFMAQSPPQIKETRCFTNKAKKLFICAEFEPSAAVTGGTFYDDDRNLHTELIDYVRGFIFQLVKLQGAVSVGQMHAALEGEMMRGGAALLQHHRLSISEVGVVAQTLALDGVLYLARVGNRVVSRRGGGGGGGLSYYGGTSSSSSSGGGDGGGGAGVADRIYRRATGYGCSSGGGGAGGGGGGGGHDIGACPWITSFPPISGGPVHGVGTSVGGTRRAPQCDYLNHFLQLPSSSSQPQQQQDNN